MRFKRYVYDDELGKAKLEKLRTAALRKWRNSLPGSKDSQNRNWAALRAALGCRVHAPIGDGDAADDRETLRAPRRGLGPRAARDREDALMSRAKPDTRVKRARRIADELVAQDLAKLTAQDLAELTAQDRAKVEKLIAKREKLIAKLEGLIGRPVTPEFLDAILHAIARYRRARDTVVPTPHSLDGSVHRHRRHRRSAPRAAALRCRRDGEPAPRDPRSGP